MSLLLLALPALFSACLCRLGWAATLAAGFIKCWGKSKKNCGGQPSLAWSLAWYHLNTSGHRRLEGKERWTLAGSGRGGSRSMTAPPENGICSASGLQAVRGRWHFAAATMTALLMPWNWFLWHRVRTKQFNLHQWCRKTYFRALLRTLNLHCSLWLEQMKQLGAV